jgi:hypothetical protein
MELVDVAATATSKVSAFDQVTDFQADAEDADRDVHVIASGDVMTRLAPSEDTATKSEIPDAHVTCSQVFAAAAVRAVQVIPSGEECTVPSRAVTAKMLPDHAIDDATTPTPQDFVRAVQVMPSGDVMTPVPTATNSPRLDAQVTPRHANV